MTLASTPNLTFGYLLETAWGTTPASALKTLRITGESLETVTTTGTALEILGSREVQDIMRYDVQGKGGINFFLSYGNLDDLLQALFQSTWVSNVLKPASVFTSLTLEKHFADVARYHTYKGAVIDQMTLSMKVGSPISGTMTVISKAGISASSTAGTGAQVAAPTNPVMEVVDHIQLLKENGSSIANVSEVTLSVKNNMRAQMALANSSPVGMGTGMFEVDGTMIAFFSDDTLLAEYLAFTATSIEFKLGGVSSLNYDFLMSKVKYTKAAVLGKAPNGDVMVELAFSAFFDATNSTLMITRTP